MLTTLEEARVAYMSYRAIAKELNDHDKKNKTQRCQTAMRIVIGAY